MRVLLLCLAFLLVFCKSTHPSDSTQNTIAKPSSIATISDWTSETPIDPANVESIVVLGNTSALQSPITDASASTLSNSATTVPPVANSENDAPTPPVLDSNPNRDQGAVSSPVVPAPEASTQTTTDSSTNINAELIAGGVVAASVAALIVGVFAYTRHVNAPVEVRSGKVGEH